MDVEQQEASWGSLWDSELPEFADLGEVLLSPPPPTQAATASAGGQQARAKRARGRGSGGGRPSLLRSSFRGVAVHPRTGRQALGQAPHPCLCPPPLSLPPCRAPTSLRWACRVEAHVWVAGRQLYGSGFYSQEVAALAYDLLSVRAQLPHPAHPARRSYPRTVRRSPTRCACAAASRQRHGAPCWRHCSPAARPPATHCCCPSDSGLAGCPAL